VKKGILKMSQKERDRLRILTFPDDVLEVERNRGDADSKWTQKAF